MSRCALLVLGTAALCSCIGGSSDTTPPASSPVATSAPPSSIDARIDQARERAVAFLLAKQDADGAWRSEVYGTFKDGPSYTPLILHALLIAPQNEKTQAAVRKAADYLAGMVGSDGTIAPPVPLVNPVYTSALAILAFVTLNDRRYDKARDAWIAYLKARQLTEQLGWEPGDKPYGGWGYATLLPKKPNKGEGAPPLTESNLSATLYAVHALHTSGTNKNDPLFAKALLFIDRCQNWQEDAKARDARFDDGGFFFIYDDPVRNKAGVAGKDATGTERYNSYGSVTADGLRAMLYCGRAKDHRRILAARAWLEKHFKADSHPGQYAPQAELNRQAVYFYYVASVSSAFRLLGLEKLVGEKGEVAWRQSLALELLKRQQKDGSWVNEAHAVREDDPLLATAFALLALSAVR